MNKYCILIITLLILILLVNTKSSFTSGNTCSAATGKLPANYLGMSKAENEQMLIKFIKNGNP